MTDYSFNRRALIVDIVTLASQISLIPVAVLMSHSRLRRIAYVRFAVYIVAREHGHSFPAIGARTNKDHSSVVHGSRRAAELEAEDPEYASFLAELRGACAVNEAFVPQIVVVKQVYTPPPIKVRPPTTKPKNHFAVKRCDSGEGDGIEFRAMIRQGSRALADAINEARAA